MCRPSRRRHNTSPPTKPAGQSQPPAPIPRPIARSPRHRLPCPRPLPDGDSDGAVPRINKPPLAELLHQQLGLTPSREVGRAVAGEYVVENAEMLRDFSGNDSVAARRQADGSPARLLVPQPL